MKEAITGIIKYIGTRGISSVLSFVTLAIISRKLSTTDILKLNTVFIAYGMNLSSARNCLYFTKNISRKNSSQRSRVNSTLIAENYQNILSAFGSAFIFFTAKRMGINTSVAAIISLECGLAVNSIDGLRLLKNKAPVFQNYFLLGSIIALCYYAINGINLESAIIGLEIQLAPMALSSLYAKYIYAFRFGSKPNRFKLRKDFFSIFFLSIYDSIIFNGPSVVGQLTSVVAGMSIQFINRIFSSVVFLVPLVQHFSLSNENSFQNKEFGVIKLSRNTIFVLLVAIFAIPLIIGLELFIYLVAGIRTGIEEGICVEILVVGLAFLTSGVRYSAVEPKDLRFGLILLFLGALGMTSFYITQNIKMNDSPVFVTLIQLGFLLMPLHFLRSKLSKQAQ